MAKISTYPSANPVNLSDKVIGTDSANNDATKNFTVQSIVDLSTPVNVSFNPQFTDAGGLLAGVTSSASYTLIGDICYFRVYVDFAGCSNFGTTQYQITLPFPSIQTMRQAGGTLHETTGAALYHIAGITDTVVSNTIHKLYYSGSTTDLAWKNTTPVGGTTVTSHFDISGVYQIA
jgi:hypothetical protein